MLEPPDGYARLKNGHHLKPDAVVKLAVRGEWVDASLSIVARTNRRSIGVRWPLLARFLNANHGRVSVDRVAVLPDAIEVWALFEYDPNNSEEE